MHSSSSPTYFPIALRIDGCRVLIVGGGQIAAHKLQLLLNKNAIIEVFALTLCPEMESLRQKGLFRFLGKFPDQNQLKEKIKAYRLIFAATGDHSQNQKIAQFAQQYHIPVCAVDDPQISSFITPAIINRQPVQIAISTGGMAPILARRIRSNIEAILDQTTGKVAYFMGKYRDLVRQSFPDVRQRRHIWENFIDGPGGNALRHNNQTKALTVLNELLSQKPIQRGEIWLVGAGPGDPELLTLRALNCLQNADTILYDHLLSDEILQRARRDATMIFVGKQCHKHSFSQEEINNMLIKYARQEKRVLRLKGGDPLIFGRGGEEIEALIKANIPFQIIPGITAANGCAAYAGIPLTHRDCAQACLFLTGHARKDGTLELPWDTMLHPNQTLVIYMGLNSLSHLCKELIQRGMDPNWPAATIERGTLPNQRVITGTLKTLPDLIQKSSFQSPCLTFVGQVVKHRVISNSYCN